MTEAGIQVPELREAIIARDRSMCRYCAVELDGLSPDKVPAIDHVNPRCKGGSDAPSNLVTACRSCNSRKGGRTPEEAGMQLLPEGSEEPLLFWHALQIVMATGVTEQAALKAVRFLRSKSEVIPVFNKFLQQCRSQSARRLLLSLEHVGSCVTGWRDKGSALVCDLDVEEGEDHGIYMDECEIGFIPVTWCTPFPYDFDVHENCFGSQIKVLISDTAPTAETMRSWAELGDPFLWFSCDEVGKDAGKCLRTILKCLSHAQGRRSTVDYDGYLRGKRNGYKSGWADRGKAIVHVELLEAAE